MLPQNPPPIDPTPLDTIAGAKMLQARFRSLSLDSGQTVMHGGRRATFIRMSNDGAAIIRHWGDSRAVAVSPDTLSLPPKKPRSLRAPFAHPSG
jgi:hypothetical protein